MKNIFYFALAFALIAACSKENKVTISDSAEVRLIKVKANLITETKLAYTSDNQTNEGFKVSWENTDGIWLYVNNDTKTTRYATNMPDAGATSGSITPDASDPANATINLNAGTETGAYKYGAYIDTKGGNSKAMYPSNGYADIDYSSQLGTEADAHLYDVYYAEGADLSELGDLTSLNGSSLNFQDKTAILKLVLTFPESTGTAENIVLHGTGIYKKVNMAWGKADASSTFGDIVVPSATISGNVATVYMALWANTVQNVTVSASVGENRYCYNVGTSVKELKGGYVYTARRSDYTLVINKWVNDEAGSAPFAAGGSETLTNDWLSYESGTVKWTANTTGAPRTAKLIFANGSTFEVTQIDVAHFTGNFTLTGDTRKATVKGSVAKATTTISPGAGDYPNPSGQTAGQYYDAGWVAPGNAAGTNTSINITQGTGAYNLSISGMYENLVMPAKVSIDYANKTISYALHIENVAYSLTSGVYNGEFAAFETELRNISDRKWQLGFANGGAFDYVGNVTLDGTKISIAFPQGQTCTAFNKYKVVGILVNRFATSTTNGGNLIRSQKSIFCFSQRKSGGAAYAWVTQGDFSMNN